MALYYMLNKPRGYLSARRDPVYPTVLDFFPRELAERLHLVGRLDLDTEGLLLLTDDGALDFYLLRPEHHVEKEYYFRSFGKLEEDIIPRLEEGVTLPNNIRACPARAWIDRYGTIGENEALFRPERAERYMKNPGRPVTEGRLRITEGRKHQVKLMIKAVGGHVFYLKRLAIGSLRLDETLAPGQYRALTPEDLALLGYAPPKSGEASEALSFLP